MPPEPSHDPLAPEVFDLGRWDASVDQACRAKLQMALEEGRILLMPRLAFALTMKEQTVCDARIVDNTSKNISFDADTGAVSGASPEAGAILKGMMTRFAAQSAALISALLPSYATSLETGRTSFRPVEVAGRTTSRLKDDTLLHVDAFPSRPVAGRRILRVFANINPTGKTRDWTIGEPFESFSLRFLSRVKPFHPWQAMLLATVGITKARRTAYDHLMLGLHDAAKEDSAYQATAPKRPLAFPAGSIWICFSDQVVHSAHSGQFAVEQTFYLPPAAMAAPERAPLSVLERLAGRRLV